MNRSQPSIRRMNVMHPPATRRRTAWPRNGMRRLALGAVLVLAIGWSPPAFGQSATRRLLREHEITGPAAEAIAACVEHGIRAGLPEDAMVTRLREGLVKQADPEAILAALRVRKAALSDARNLLRGADLVTGRREDASLNALHDTLARALESGMPVAAFEGLLADGRFRREAWAQRFRTIIEAGEMLHLAGVDVDALGPFMRDCRDRNLRRMEILRAVRFWLHLHREGVSPDDIRRRLWSGRPPGHDGHRRGRSRENASSPRLGGRGPSSGDE